MSRVLNESDAFPSLRCLTYRESQSPPELRPVLECFWRREPWRPPNHGLGVLPDGRVDLIWAAGEALVIGPQTRSVKRPLPPQVAVVGARFAPGVGPSVLGVPAHELANVHVPLEAIDARPAGYLLRDLAAVESDATAASLIAHAIAKRVDSGRSRDVAVQRATALLADPGTRVARVAHALGLSERQLQRRFRDAVGYGPKTLQRVLRFQRLLTALRLGRNQPGGLAFIAAAIGYSDQAHLTREAREFSGLSPSRLSLALDALAEAGAPGVFKTGRPPRRDINARRPKPRAVQPPNGRARRPGSRRRRRPPSSR